MALTQTVASARNFAVMVRVRGPVSAPVPIYYVWVYQYVHNILRFQDPKGMKMRRHAFHQYR